MKRLIALASAGALAFSLTGCAGGSVQTETVDFPGFSMEVPEGWELHNIGEDHYMYLPPGEGQKDVSISLIYDKDEYGLIESASTDDLAFWFEDTDGEYSEKHSNVEESFVDGHPMMTGDTITSFNTGDEVRYKEIAFFINDSDSVHITISKKTPEMEQYAEKAIESIEITG